VVVEVVVRDSVVAVVLKESRNGVFL